MGTDRRKPSAPGKASTVVTVPLGGVLAGKLNRVQARLGLSAVDLLRISLVEMLHELERNGRLVLFPPLEDGQASAARIVDPLWREAQAVSEAVGVSPLELAREGLRRVVDEFQTEGQVRFHKRSAPRASGGQMPDSQPAPAMPGDNRTAAHSTGACSVQPELAN